MTSIEFVGRRLNDMQTYPKCWGTTCETFGMQLVLLAEMAVLPPQNVGEPNQMHSLMVIVFRKLDANWNIPLDEEWAREAVKHTRQWIYNKRNVTV